MKRFVVTAALLTLFSARPHFAQSAPASATLTQHDREFALSSLHATRKIFLDSVNGLTPQQWNFKSAPDRWSIAECAEHIAISEDFFPGLVQTSLKGPATPETRALIKATDELILEKFADRSQKFKAPEPIAPTKRWANPLDSVAHFKESRDRNIAYIDTTQDDLRNHTFPHPAAGMMDSYQWLLGMSAHSERHTLQILEVKADPKYPK